MTETQIPIAALIAFVTGCIAGTTIRHSTTRCILVVGIVALLNMLGWVAYGYSITKDGNETTVQIIAALIWVAPGFFIFIGLPCLVGGSFFALMLKKKQKPNKGLVRTGDPRTARQSAQP